MFHSVDILEFSTIQILRENKKWYFDLGACHSSKNFEISAKLRAFKIVKMGVFDVLKIYFN